MGGARLAQGGRVVFSVVNNKENKLDCTPPLRHETRKRLVEPELAADESGNGAEHLQHRVLVGQKHVAPPRPF
jgi:hypothetical protein